MNEQTTPNTSGQMQWRRPDPYSNETAVLHLRYKPTDPWKPYTHFPHLMIPDGCFSKGFPTFGKLVKQGWEVIPIENPNPKPPESGSIASGL